MDGALAQFATIVGQHDGKVLQYAGDSLLAVFGADEAREDDPERAVRAGLALLDEGRRQGERVRRQHGHDGFNVRVGVHTGGVLLGGGVDAEGSIRGQAVNIAARMEQTAPAGGLRISHDTYRHVRGVFDVEPQPPMAVKGVDEPVVTYLVLRAKPRAFRVATRGIEGVETRMVGRDAELEQLQDAFYRLCSGGTLAAVTVVAEAGIGKSRLLYEFENWAEAQPERFELFQGRADPQTQSQPYGLLRDMLAWRLQIADSDSMEAAKQQARGGHRAAVRRRRRRRHGPGPRPSAGPPDRPGLRRQPARPRHPGRRAADPQPRLPCRGAGVPPGRAQRRRADRAAARRPALGRRRLAGLPEPPRRRSTATCRC